MTVLTFSAPQNFSDSFQVPVDHSVWNGQYEKIKMLCHLSVIVHEASVER